jgi:hypothetical protein
MQSAVVNHAEQLKDSEKGATLITHSLLRREVGERCVSANAQGQSIVFPCSALHLLLIKELHLRIRAFLTVET